MATPELQQARDQHQQKIQQKMAEIQQLVEVANQHLVRDARAHVGDYFLAAVRELELKTALKTTKPIGPSESAVRERGARIVEAENFDRGNVLKVLDGYGQGIGVLVNKGELPNFTDTSGLSDLTRNTARSTFGSLPINSAFNFRPSLNITVISSASPMT